MPDAMTHIFMATDVLEKLNVELDQDIFKLASQGPDPLFYHHSLPYQSKSQMGEFGNKMHEVHTDGFFYYLVEYIKKNPSNYLKSFLYGFVCHHVLDYNAHPYVFYMTGDYNKENKKTYKYRGLHLEMERGIDRYFIEKRMNIKPEKFKAYNFFLNVQIKNELKNMLNNCIQELYGMNHFGDIYEESVSDMYKTFKYVAYDPTGLKKKIYRLIDKYINTRSSVVYEHVSYYQSKDSKSYLNLDHNEYFHPCDANISYNYSFLDLVENATEEAYMIISELEKYFSGQRKDFYNLFKGYNYSTGLYWKEDQTMSNFKF